MGRGRALVGRTGARRAARARADRAGLARASGRAPAGGRGPVGGHPVRGLEVAVGGVSGRPRLLFLCQTLPWPPDGGVWIRTYHVLRLLARAFDVTALCFERAGTGPGFDVAQSRAALSALADVEVFAIPQRHSRLRYLWDHARSAARGRVYT